MWLNCFYKGNRSITKRRFILRESIASGKVAIAPAIKNGEKQYFYVDENKGEGYCKEYQEYICVDATGKIIKPTYVSEHFGVILRQHQLPKIRFHDLRHSCASLLLSNGVPMKMIQDWLGHSDMGTTANIYSHIDAASKLMSANVMGSTIKI
ncbi:MAG: tyrosine-type recombinase/integrase [Clostridia bacterium]|nr:tyrosine-type recombinase/integrase [Clostridia bacterium]